MMNKYKAHRKAPSLSDQVLVVLNTLKCASADEVARWLPEVSVAEVHAAMLQLSDQGRAQPTQGSSDSVHARFAPCQATRQSA